MDLPHTKNLTTSDGPEFPRRLMGVLAAAGDMRSMIREATALLQDWLGCEAVGIRLRDGDDFPYYETRGFPAEFLLAENWLCARDLAGQIVRDTAGNPVLDCMCGNVLQGRFDPTKPFFTVRGSFWSNNTTALLASTTEADRQARTRNRCNGEGYESVALIALRQDGRTLGLLQVNDSRPDRFSAEGIAELERISDALALTVARFLADEEGVEAMRRLRKSERHFSQLYHEAPLGYQSLDADGYLLDVNREWLRLLGYKRAEVVGRSFADFLVAEDRPLFGERFPRFKQAGEVHGVEFTMVRKDGQTAVMSFDGRISRNDAGEFVRTHCIMHDVTEQRRAAAELRSSYAELQAVYDSAPVMMCVTDQRRCIQYANLAMKEFIARVGTSAVEKRACGVLGCVNAFEDPRGCGYGARCPDCRLREAIDDSLATGNVHRAVETIMTVAGRDGVKGHVLLASTTRIHERPPRVLLCLEDITLRKRAESHLRIERDLAARLASEHGVQPILQLSLECALQISEFDGGAVYLVDGQTGAVDLAMHQGLSPEFVAAVRHYEPDSIQAEVVRRGEFQELPMSQCATSKSSAPFPEEWRMVVVIPVVYEGRPVACLNLSSSREGAVPSDIRAALEVVVSQMAGAIARARAEEARLQSENLYRQIVETANEGVLIVDAEFRCTYVNRQLADMIGYTEAEMLGRSVDEFTFPENLAGLHDRLDGLRRGWGGRFEQRALRKDGSECWLLVSVTALAGADGEFVGACGMFADITDRKRDDARMQSMERQLRHSSRLAVMGELAAGIAHELNQPLYSIVNFAKACRNMAAQPAPDLAKLCEWCEALSKAAAHSGDIVRRMGRFSRRSEGQRLVAPVARLIDDAAMLVRFDTESRKVTLHKRVEIDNANVNVDPVQIHQVLVNLLRNAIESLADDDRTDKTVGVEAVELDGSVRITVWDNGPGMPPDWHQWVFEPFFTSKPEGLGLGLAISKTIVEAHGGRIWIGQSPRGGAAVHFVLPICTEEVGRHE